MDHDKTFHCPGKDHRMGMFLEASLLLLLKKQCAHGYGLMEQLEQLGFDTNELNASTLYRTLRKMEKSGLVISKWEEGEGGPNRRVYEITPQGVSDLNEWHMVFQEREKRIQRFLEVYEKNCGLDGEAE